MMAVGLRTRGPEGEGEIVVRNKLILMKRKKDILSNASPL